MILNVTLAATEQLSNRQQIVGRTAHTLNMCFFVLGPFPYTRANKI